MNNTVTLANGVEMPQIGYGTLHIPNDRNGADIIISAIRAGYRNLDTAAKYGNEAAVGTAVRECGLPREEIFVTSKLDNNKRGYDTTLEDFERALEVMKLDYLDLYLIHWPAGSYHYPDWEQINLDTWRALEKVYKEGKVRAIGVSNFWPHHLKAITDHCEIAPMVDQIKVQPGLLQSEIVRYCQYSGILVEAYSPLGAGDLIGAEKLVWLAEKYQKTPAQIIIRWDLQHGISPIPRSTNPVRMAQNLDVFDFEISDEDMDILDTMPNALPNPLADPDKLNLK